VPVPVEKLIPVIFLAVLSVWWIQTVIVKNRNQTHKICLDRYLPIFVDIAETLLETYLQFFGAGAGGAATFCRSQSLFVAAPEPGI
jgi:hypothetical protein